MSLFDVIRFQNINPLDINSLEGIPDEILIPWMAECAKYVGYTHSILKGIPRGYTPLDKIKVIVHYHLNLNQIDLSLLREEVMTLQRIFKNFLIRRLELYDGII